MRIWVVSPGRRLGFVVKALTIPRRLRAPRFHGRARFALDLAPLYGLALVVVFLAFGETHGHLDAAVLEVQPDGHERHALFDGLADQLADLLAVQQQLAPAQRLVIRVAAVAVRADIDVVEIDLAVLQAREAVARVDAAFTDGLTFGP